MKKSLIGILGLSAMALVACGGEGEGGNSGNNARIRIWGPTEERAVVEAVIGAYNDANPNDKITYDFTAITEADAGTTVAADPTVEGYPALFACADDHLSNLATIRGIVTPLPNIYAEDVIEATAETAVTAGSIDGQLYAYPISVDNGYFLYYDARVYDETDVATFEGLLEKSDEAGKQVIMDVGNGYYSAAFFLAQGVCGPESITYEYQTNKSGTQQVAVYDCNWDSDEAAEMIYETSKLFTTYGSKEVTPDATMVGAEDSGITTGLGNGTLGAFVSGTWLNANAVTAWGDNVRAVKLPTLHGHQLGSFAGTKLYCVNGYATPQEQATAHKVAQILTSKEAQLTRYELRSSIPCNLEAQADEDYIADVANNPTLAALQEQSEYAAVQATSAEAAYWTVGEAIGVVMLSGTYTENEVETDLNAGGVAAWKKYLESQVALLTDPAALDA